jgi:signal transduction histidine kinase
LIYAKDVFFTVFRAQADRVIALVRLAIAIGGLFITWLDAAHPPISPLIVRALLTLYLLFAVFSAWQAWRTAIPRVRGTLVRHVIDLAFIFLAGFLYTSEGSTNPFTLLMPFVILAGTLHWRHRGAFWTAIACGLILAVIVVTDTRESLDLDTESTRDVSLILYIVVSAILLIWLGVREDSVRADVLNLVIKAPDAPEDLDWPSDAALAYAHRVVPSERAILIWTDGQEPWTYIAFSDGSESTAALAPPDVFAPWVAAEISAESIISTRALDGAVRIHRGGGRFDDWRGPAPAINEALNNAYDLDTCISVAFQVEDLQARLFLVEPIRLTLHQVAVAEIIADRLRVLFQHSILTRRLSHTAAMEERVKIGRELHDGFQQALAGTALELESIRKLLAGSPEATARLNEIQATLSEEQSRFRTFVRALEQVGEPAEGGLSLLPLHFDSIVSQFKRQWPIEISLLCDPVDAELPPLTMFHLTKVLTDAVAAIVHTGDAKSIVGSAKILADMIVIELEHDGAAIQLTSSNTSDDVDLSLHSEVAGLGGAIQAVSTPTGARLQISLPIAGRA